MSIQSGNSVGRKWMQRTGWSMTGLMVLFMLFDSISKLAMEHHVVEATTKIGYPLDTIRPLRIIGLICTVLYAIPRTSILGAIVLTGLSRRCDREQGANRRSTL
jgi:hypothetical protein